MKKPIIVITGPTASGKTALSLDVAKKINAEIICADSMTVYRGMDIGTDKPTLLIKDIKDRKKISDGSYLINGIPHHLLNIVDPDENFNVCDFREKVKKIAEKIHERGNIPVLVGGSTMYIDAFVYDYMIPNVEPDFDLRAELEEQDCDELFGGLLKLDPDAAWTIDRKNKRRLVRALEVTLKTGTPFTHQKKKENIDDNILYIAITRPRTELYGSINSRVDEMMKDGFLDEVKKLFKKYDHNTAMQAAGYKQLIGFLEGEMSIETAVEKTKQVHRNYAKRQMTWLKKNKDIVWVSNSKQAEEIIKKFLP